ncbi:DNA repair protein-like protein [Hapsidospora chrysogenum ATCC 11550]|uniref:DNA repair protein-like protein n=1 Tax=Hapsidospora chrysogenum (strain ATCC 11550 / CBS 779.69 / DSM 880 / IAM 14645 / JCM 23072 / IMI 49137) TaxID=857340 RepID=A0A086T822_HAPC1|nr:DNA repair protein-like protein [Hapsidospora chrysogenum ATCC 11550]
MGVNGLWTVVQPCARPTNLATLNRKRLAVDASIWIYQFLKAVRDKEGNALRNSHVVGFFRRICKLLWFGIQPVFVFDGGAPALKRATIQARQRRREGRREDAVKTAGKLLAVQMQRIAEDEVEKRKREQFLDTSAREEAAQREEVPDMDNVVYAGELGMSQSERQRTRKFHKQDQYHLPELEGGIASMGKPDDPRIMSVEELEEYARQFNDGEDINLYDFSKIDFDGDFFKSLPPPDRYNILNAARLRSRLRMGLSKEQLDEMFPDRMAFSKFQIERVKERNHLTQRLMYEVGMTGTDLTLAANARIAGEKDREYILVKNEGAEGGWALGVVSKEKDVGEAHKPIDVDAIQIQYQSKEAEDEDEDEEFEDVPIEGVNRLPKSTFSSSNGLLTAQDMAPGRQQFYQEHREEPGEDGEDSLFVGGNTGEANQPPEEKEPGRVHPEEEDDLNMAIALSLQNQYGVGQSETEDDVDEEPAAAPEWIQRSADASRPITGSAGSIIAHVVNNRASAAVPKRQESKEPDTKTGNDSDSDEDMQAVLARSRKQRLQQPKPILENKKNPFDGPLPFPKLDWRSSLFSKSSQTRASKPREEPKEESVQSLQDQAVEDDMAGGFERTEDDGPPPLPPWLADQSDIRESLKKQQDLERDANAEDRAEAEEEERLRRRMRDEPVEIESSDDDQLEVVEKPPSLCKDPEKTTDAKMMASRPLESNTDKREQEEGILSQAEKTPMLDGPAEVVTAPTERRPASESPEPEFEEVPEPRSPEGTKAADTEGRGALGSPEPEFEDVPAPTTLVLGDKPPAPAAGGSSTLTHDVPHTQSHHPIQGADDDDLFADVEYDEFSDPGDEELLASLAEEAEEHARFASELNNKSTQQNKEDYEKELRQLRNQQKKDRRDADEVTQVMVTECQALLRLFGIPYITAPMEAEAQCAELVNLGLVDGIVTDDSDIFLFGGTRIYKNMFNTNKFVECYLASDLEKELSLSREQLISLAQLLGSDYTEGLAGVGPVTAVEILSEFPGKSGLEDFREWWMAVQAQTRPKEADASSPFRRKFRKSQGTKLFLPTGFPSSAVYEAYLHPQVDDSTEPFQWGVPDLEGLRRFLMATIGWSKERTDEVLVPVIKDMNKRDVEGTQSNITRFFSGSVGAGAKDAFAPRQRAQGSKRMLAAVDRLRSNVSGEQGGPKDNAPASKRKRIARRNTVEEEEVEEDQDVDQGAQEGVNEVNTRSRGKGKRAKAS